MTAPANNSGVSSQYEIYKNLINSSENEPNDEQEILSDVDFVALMNNVTENAIEVFNNNRRQAKEDSIKVAREYRKMREQEALKTNEAANILTKKHD